MTKVDDQKAPEQPGASTVAGTCERCGQPLTLTSRGKLRRGKRFCSVACQQAAVRQSRAQARRDLEAALRALELIPGAAEGVRTLRDLLRHIGMLRR